MKIGILGVHGSREEHAEKMQQLGCDTCFIRSLEDLEGIDGIILPGGESTSFGRLMNWSGIYTAIQNKIVKEHLPVFGTCAGAILLSASGSDFSMGALDIAVDRNAYGSQVESFSDEVFIPMFHDTFHSLFIRAPKIVSVGESVEVLAEYNTSPVLVRSREFPFLASTFHPELTSDIRIHSFFLNMIEKKA